MGIAASKRAIANLLRRSMGRKNLIRLGRYLLNAGRLDDGNDMQLNGEYRLIKEVMHISAQRNASCTVIDVGANLGMYAHAVIDEAERANITDLTLIAIEACAGTFEMLKEHLIGCRRDTNLSVLHLAMSDRTGIAKLSVIGAGAGRNSLLAGVVPDSCTTEDVALTTLDRILVEQGHEAVDLVKIDTEGHDINVLRGAYDALHRGAVGVVQFEYNWRWIEQRAFLRDVFNLISDFNYAIGKVTPYGLEIFDSWLPHFETFAENNYALVRRDLLQWFSQVSLASDR